jgi:hypothetical protein
MFKEGIAFDRLQEQLNGALQRSFEQSPAGVRTVMRQQAMVEGKWLTS